MTQRKATNQFFLFVVQMQKHTVKSELIFYSVVMPQFLLVGICFFFFFPFFFPGKWTSSSSTFPADLNYPSSPINCSGSLSISGVQVLVSQKSCMYRRCRMRLIVLKLAFDFTFEQLEVVFRVPANAWRQKSFSRRHKQDKELGKIKRKCLLQEQFLP